MSEKIEVTDQSPFELGEKQMLEIDQEIKSVTLKSIPFQFEKIIPGPIMRYKIPEVTFALYYRNVPRDVVMFEIGDYAALRKLEQEIRLIDPGNYLAIHELKPVTEDKIESIIKELFE